MQVSNVLEASLCKIDELWHTLDTTKKSGSREVLGQLLIRNFMRLFQNLMYGDASPQAKPKLRLYTDHQPLCGYILNHRYLESKNAGFSSCSASSFPCNLLRGKKNSANSSRTPLEFQIGQYVMLETRYYMIQQLFQKIPIAGIPREASQCRENQQAATETPQN